MLVKKFFSMTFLILFLFSSLSVNALAIPLKLNTEKPQLMKSSASPVIGIEVLSPPEQTLLLENADGHFTSYFDNNTEIPFFEYVINQNGFKMLVKYRDGTTEQCVLDEHMDSFNGHFIYFRTDQHLSPWDIGEHTVTVSYMGYTDEFTVEVIENPVSGIEILSAPFQTQIVEGAYGWWEFFWNGFEDEQYYRYNIERGGLEVRVHYKDLSQVDYKFDEHWYEHELNGFAFEIRSQEHGEHWDIGEHAVTVYYMGYTDEFTVEVIENPVSGIEILSAPFQTEIIEYTNGMWESFWDGGEEDCYYRYHMDIRGLELQINYKDNSSAIYLFEEPQHELYGYNIELITNENGEQWDVGEHTVIVSYMGHTDEFTINIVESPLLDIQILQLPTKTIYIQGEMADIEGLELKLNYKDNTSKTVNVDNLYDEYHWSADFIILDGYEMRFSIDTEKQKILISYLGITVSFDVIITPHNFTAIRVKNSALYFNGVGATLIITTYDDTEIEVTIGRIDVWQDDDLKGHYMSEGFAKTSYGIFPIYSEVFYSDNYEIIGFRFEFNGIEVSDEILHEKSPAAMMLKRIAIVSQLRGLFGGQEYDFNGTLTQNNIDSIAISAWAFLDDKSNTAVAAAEMELLIQRVFSLSNVDLSMSDYYNSQTQTYHIPDGENFVFFDFFEDIFVTTTQEGDFLIKYSFRWDNEYTYYAVISTEQKIKYLSSNQQFIEFEILDESQLSINDDYNALVSVHSPITVSELVSQFQGGTMAVYKNGILLETNEYVGTGCTIALMIGNETIDTLDVVVCGDINGDAVVDAADLFLMNKVINGHSSLEGIAYVAANLDEADEALNIFDYQVIENLVFNKV